MLRRLLYFVIVLLCLSSVVEAEENDCVLFGAYQRRDMAVWRQHLVSIPLETTDARLARSWVVYAYGYVAYMLEYEDRDSALLWLDRYEERLERYRQYLSEAEYLAFSAARHAYEIKAGRGSHIMHGLSSMNNARRAARLEPQNPQVLMIQGHVLYYAPKMAGGSQGRAWQLYKEAMTLFEQQGREMCNWQYEQARLLTM